MGEKAERGASAAAPPAQLRAALVAQGQARAEAACAAARAPLCARAEVEVEAVRVQERAARLCRRVWTSAVSTQSGPPPPPPPRLKRRGRRRRPSRRTRRRSPSRPGSRPSSPHAPSPSVVVWEEALRGSVSPPRAGRGWPGRDARAPRRRVAVGAEAGAAVEVGRPECTAGCPAARPGGRGRSHCPFRGAARRRSRLPALWSSPTLPADSVAHPGRGRTPSAAQFPIARAFRRLVRARARHLPPLASNATSRPPVAMAKLQPIPFALAVTTVPTAAMLFGSFLLTKLDISPKTGAVLQVRRALCVRQSPAGGTEAGGGGRGPCRRTAPPFLHSAPPEGSATCTPSSVQPLELPQRVACTLRGGGASEE